MLPTTFARSAAPLPPQAVSAPQPDLSAVQDSLSPPDTFGHIPEPLVGDIIIYEVKEAVSGYNPYGLWGNL